PRPSFDQKPEPQRPQQNSFNTPRPPVQNPGSKMVLADAIKKATLEREETLKAKTVVENTKRTESENDLRKAISLSYLEHDNLKPEKNEKSAKPEQINMLRDLIATKKEEVKQPLPTVTPKKLNEVPEDVLKDILNS
ncbi:MAG: hypothetical protein WCO16_03535, partial [bacterium]